MRFLLFETILMLCGSAGLAESECPSPCKCDTFGGFKRASCGSQRLVTVEQELPQDTQFLDLSHNNIMEIRDGAFSLAGLSALRSLNVSHNRIGQIHMNAFNGLHDLRILDLSHNSVQYLLPHWFWELFTLEELYLNNNDLFSFQPDGPYFESSTLQILDVSYSRLRYINRNAFARLPALEVLDVSGNFLFQFSRGIVKPLRNLRILNAANNSWPCTNAIKELARYCAANGVKYTDACHTKVEMKFERMISKTSDRLMTETTTAGDYPKSTTEPNEIKAVPPPQFHVLSELIVYIVTIAVSFAMGVAAGLAVGCNFRSRRTTRLRPVRYKKRQGQCLMDDVELNGDSTPLASRKNRAVKT